MKNEVRNDEKFEGLSWSEISNRTRTDRNDLVRGDATGDIINVDNLAEGPPL